MHRMMRLGESRAQSGEARLCQGFPLVAGTKLNAKPANQLTDSLSDRSCVFVEALTEVSLSQRKTSTFTTTPTSGQSYHQQVFHKHWNIACGWRDEMHVATHRPARTAPARDAGSEQAKARERVS
jgi:hypothetical protein